MEQIRDAVGPSKGRRTTHPLTGEEISRDEDRLSYQLGLVPAGDKTARRGLVRAYRFKGQEIARRWLRSSLTPKGKRWRVIDCNRVPVPDAAGAGSVVIAKSGKPDGAADFRGLVRCGQVWTCPCCASKVAQERSAELRSALVKHREKDLLAVAVTFTLPHGTGDRAAYLLEVIGSSLKRMRANRRIVDMRKSLGFVGAVRALEVTWGKGSGWHPHIHEVWFFDLKDYTPEAVERIQDTVRTAWMTAVTSCGHASPSYERGAWVEAIDKPRDYESKGVGSIDGVKLWDAADEFTKAVQKVGRYGRQSPFDLLFNGHREVFEEYANAFFGKRQLFWSRGLKKHFAIADKTDEEIAAEEETEGKPLVTIPKPEWRKWVKTYGQFRAYVLSLAESASPQEVVAFLRRQDCWAFVYEVEPPPDNSG